MNQSNNNVGVKLALNIAAAAALLLQFKDGVAELNSRLICDMAFAKLLGKERGTITSDEVMGAYRQLDDLRKLITPLLNTSCDQFKQLKGSDEGFEELFTQLDRLMDIANAQYAKMGDLGDLAKQYLPMSA
jgi:soluble cytochrome b562